MAALLVIPHSGHRLRTAERIRLAFEIAATYLQARWWLVRLDFERSVGAARRVDAGGRHLGSPAETMHAAVMLGKYVERSLDALPFDGRCLLRSLVLTRMLARRGIDSTFVLGVRARPDFIAHAWLERRGVPLLLAGPEFHRLHEL